MDGDNDAPRRSLGMTKLAILLALVAGLGFAGGLSVGAKSINVFDRISFFSGLDATPDETVDLADFWRVWNALDGRFVETNASSSEPDSREKIWGAIEGLAASYEDPYTLFLRPEDA
ncbi:hypothetical protein L0Y34_00495, partial [Candidatus Parcubacteria bacterium]|nr:hypothetical protein [Candidatus Parcubacteria bacterium]